MDREVLQRHLAEGLSLAEIGEREDRHPSTVGYWLKKHGLRGAHRHRHRSRGGIERRKLETLIADGSSVTSMAVTLGVSRSTINYWLRKYRLRAVASSRRREKRRAKEAGMGTARMTCVKHGLTDFWLEGRGYYRCLRCRGENVARHRRKLKATLVKEAGGKCVICGYSRYHGALQFHHRDPAEKESHPSLGGRTRSISRLRAEARKCSLLCSNCHAEVEAGITHLPAWNESGPG